MKRLWKKFCSKALTWDQLKSFGESKVFRSANYALLLVPILVKVLAHVPDEVILSQVFPPIRLHLRLPFSWKLLFYASCVAGIGNVLYWYFCPGLVRTYVDWSDFLSKGRDASTLLAELDSVAPERESNPDAPDDNEEYADLQVARIERQLTRLGVIVPPRRTLSGLAGSLRFSKQELLPWAFNAIRDAANRSNVTARAVLTFVYISASVMVLWIMYDNLRFVGSVIWQGRF